MTAEETLDHIMGFSSGPPLESIQRHFVLIAMNKYKDQCVEQLESRLIESEQREREAFRSGYSRALATFGEQIDETDEEIISNELHSRLSGGKEEG